MNRKDTAVNIYNSALPLPPVELYTGGGDRAYGGYFDTADNLKVHFVTKPSAGKIYYTTDGSATLKTSTFYMGYEINSVGVIFEGSGTLSIMVENALGQTGDTYVYKYTLPVGDKLQADIARVLAEIIKPGMSDAQKLKAINDYLCVNLTGKSGQTDGFRLSGYSDCGGYSSTFAALAKALGFELASPNGTSPKGGTHVWNLVKLDGQWVHVDVTWNDSGSGSNDRYLFKSDTTMEKLGYTWDHSKYPSAPSDYNLSGLSTAPITPATPQEPEQPSQPGQPNTGSDNPSQPTQPSQPAQTETVRVFMNGDWKVVPKDSLEYIAIPDVVGMTVSEAASVLRNVGFTVSASSEFSETIPYGCVISVTDKGNGVVMEDGQAMTIKGATVTIIESRGQPR